MAHRDILRRRAAVVAFGVEADINGWVRSDGADYGERKVLAWAGSIHFSASGDQFPLRPAAGSNAIVPLSCE